MLPLTQTAKTASSANKNPSANIRQYIVCVDSDSGIFVGNYLILTYSFVIFLFADTGEA